MTATATVVVTLETTNSQHGAILAIPVHDESATCLADLDDIHMADLVDAIALEVESHYPATAVHVHIGAYRIAGTVTKRHTDSLLAVFTLAWADLSIAADVDAMLEEADLLALAIATDVLRTRHKEVAR